MYRKVIILLLFVNYLLLFILDNNLVENDIRPLALGYA